MAQKVWLPIKDRVQSELIKRGHCVGCGKSLADADRRPVPGQANKEFATCSCRRIYVYNKQVNSYRRARLEEVLE